MTAVVEIDMVIARRLWRLYHNDWAQGLCEGLTAAKLRTYAPVTEFIDDQNRRIDDAAWHLGRVRYFYDKLRAGEPIDPIEVDNHCSHGHVHPIPVVLDGHHRLIAAVVARARIPVSYGGRVDLLAYLKGERRHPPEC